MAVLCYAAMPGMCRLSHLLHDLHICTYFTYLLHDHVPTSRPTVVLHMCCASPSLLVACKLAATSPREASPLLHCATRPGDVDAGGSGAASAGLWAGPPENAGGRRYCPCPSSAGDRNSPFICIIYDFKLSQIHFMYDSIMTHHLS